MFDTLTDPSAVEKLRALYGRDPATRAFFDWARGMSRPRSETTVDRASQATRLDRDAVIEHFQAFEHIGLGQFLKGGRGQKARFVWQYSLSDLGEIAGTTGPVAEASPESTPAPDGQTVSAHQGQGSVSYTVNLVLTPEITPDRVAEIVRAIRTQK